ncbi:MAG: GNAT family N-acetyltransferase [Chloroflexota bacterium]|nr:GNAT family N-acetyltransferase [Chloroflexota bacterium]
MTISVDVRGATRDDIADCARVLALAFQDDPGTIIFEPDPERRALILPDFFQVFVAASLAEGADIVVAGEPVVGVASWFGPERHGPSPDAMGGHGFGGVLERAGPEATARLLAMIGELERQHDLLTDGAHLRLEFFGVIPDQQRSGVGTALIEHGHRRADERTLACYLETFTQSNVRYYQGRGWKVVAEYTVAEGVPVYGMIR